MNQNQSILGLSATIQCVSAITIILAQSANPEQLRAIHQSLLLLKNQAESEAEKDRIQRFIEAIPTPPE